MEVLQTESGTHLLVHTALLSAVIKAFRRFSHRPKDHYRR
jgi:hypothetical protein